MKKLLRIGKKKDQDRGSLRSGNSASGYNISPKKDLGKFHKAAFDGDLVKLKSFLKRGDVNQLDKENRTPLHLACTEGKIDVVRILTQHPQIQLNLCDNDQCSPLIKCVQCQQQQCLNILLDKGADVGLCDLNGNTALHIAASIPSKDFVYVLLDYRADVSSKNKDGLTPLHLASSSGAIDIVDILIKDGADINAACNDKKTPLMLAAHKGHIELVQLLLERGANAANRDVNGWTAEDYATMDGHHPIAHILLEHNKKKQSTDIYAVPMKRNILHSNKQANVIGAPALHAEDDFSQADGTLSKESIRSDSWGSDTDDDMFEKEQPKVNVRQLLQKNQNAGSAGQPQTPSGNASLFMTTNAKQELEKQKLKQDVELQSPKSEERLRPEPKPRESYNSSSMNRGQVSPSKPPLPQLSGATALVAPKKIDDDSWDSSDEESIDHHITPKKFVRPNADMMAQLGFNDEEVHDIYSGSDDEDISAAHDSKPATSASLGSTQPGEKKIELAAKDDDSSSWDEFSASEKKTDIGFGIKGTPQQPAASNTIFDRALQMKFDDESESKHANDVNEEEDSSSWNSENMVQTPDEAPASYDYVTSPPEVVKEAELRSASLHSLNKLQSQDGSRGAQRTGDNTDDDTTDLESESSWEIENKQNKIAEMKRKKLQNEMKAGMEARTRLAKLEVERIKLEAEESERKRLEYEREEKRKKEEARRKEVERIKNEHLHRREQDVAHGLSTAKVDENLMEEAFKRAAVATTESDLESSSEDEHVPNLESHGKTDEKKVSKPYHTPTSNNDSANPTNASIKLTSKNDFKKPVVDLEQLTETDEEMSAVESLSDFKHNTPFSDSIKLEEEKHSLKMKLSKDEEVLMKYRDRVNHMQNELKSTKDKEFQLLEEQRLWKMEKVDLDARNRENTYKLNETEEQLKTLKQNLEAETDKTRQLQEQVQMEMSERRQREVDNRDLQMELKNAQQNLTMVEKELGDVKKQLESKGDAEELVGMVNADRTRLSQSIQDETAKDNETELLHQQLSEKSIELMRVASERDRLKDESDRYKNELGKLRNNSSNTEFAAMNEELNQKVDELNVQLRESDEALHVAAMQSLEFKKAVENEKMKSENALNDLELLNAQQQHFKSELEKTHDALQREQERVRTLEESREKMMSKDSTLHDQLMDVEKNLSRVENELQNEKTINQQRQSELTQLKNESFKLRQDGEDKDEKLHERNREITQIEGKLKSVEADKDRYEAENVKLRQQNESLQSRSQANISDQQAKMNTMITDVHELLEEHFDHIVTNQPTKPIYKDIEKERVALETRNIQLTQQVESLKKDIQRLYDEKSNKEEELSHTLQDRLEAHKKLAYADAFSETTARENEQHKETNKMLQEQTQKLEIQVSSLQQELSNWRGKATELQSERDRHMRAATDQSRKLENLNQSFDHTESARHRLDQQLKDAEMEVVSLKVEIESLKNRNDRAEEMRNAADNSHKIAEEKISILEKQKLMLEEKLNEEESRTKKTLTDIDEYRVKWENEVKSRSEAMIGKSKIESELIEVKEKFSNLHEKFLRTTEERKHYQEKYEKLKKQKVDADNRAERYRLSMLESDQKYIETESECESKLSSVNEAFESTKGQMEVKVHKLQKEIAVLRSKLNSQNLDNGDNSDDSFQRSSEMKRLTRERDQLEKKYQSLQDHLKNNYVDRGELEAVRQEERAKAQSLVAPTLDQVNNYLKERTYAQDVLDQLRNKNEENRFKVLQQRVNELNEENIRLRRKQNDPHEQSRIQEAFSIKVRAEEMENRNKVLQHQLDMSKKNCDDYKQRWIDEKKRSQEMFSATMGGVYTPANHTNGHSFMMNGTGGRKHIISPPLPHDAFSSTPRKGSEPILNHLRNKLDAKLGQHHHQISASDHRGSSSGSSNNITPRSNDLHEDSRYPRMSSNDYLSFLPS